MKYRETHRLYEEPMRFLSELQEDRARVGSEENEEENGSERELSVGRDERFDMVRWGISRKSQCACYPLHMSRCSYVTSLHSSGTRDKSRQYQPMHDMIPSKGCFGKYTRIKEGCHCIFMLDKYHVYLPK